MAVILRMGFFKNFENEGTNNDMTTVKNFENEGTSNDMTTVES